MSGGASFNFLALGLYLFFVFIGVTLLTLGFRGRLVARLPRCAKCGQLIGRAEFERSGRCPECGNDIAARGGMRYFKRQPHKALITLGIGVGALAFLAPLGFATVGTRATPVAFGPTATVIATVRAADHRAFPSVIELERRLSTGQLTTDELKESADATITWLALADQGALVAGPSGIITAADSQKLLSDAQVHRLGSAIFRGPLVRWPAKMREPGRVQLKVSAQESRGDIAREVRLIGASENGVAIGAPSNNGTELAFALPRGKHSIAVECATSYRLGNAAVASGTGEPRLVVKSIEHIDVDVIPTDAPPFVQLVTARDEDQTRSVKAGCVVRSVAIDRDSRDGSCIVRIDLDARPPDRVFMWFAFEVLVRVGAQQVPVGSLMMVKAANGSTSLQWNPRAARCTCPPDDAKVDVIFRPDPLSVESEADIECIWGDEVLVSDVPVRRNVAGAAPNKRAPEPPP